MERLLITAIIVAAVAVAVLTGWVATAGAHGTGCHSKKCERRVLAKALAAELARYHRSPMPFCTWHRESGAHWGEWAWQRYRARNPSSTAGGKFQIIDDTWHANGGKRYGSRHPAALAPPVEQERIARRVLRSQGLGAWVLC